MKKHTLPALLMTAFVLSLTFGVTLAVRGQQKFQPTYIYKISPGRPFFKFDFTDLEGKRWAAEDLRGKPVIILTAHRRVRYDVEKWAMMLKNDFADSGKIHLLWVVNISRFPWENNREVPVQQWTDFGVPVPVILDWHSQIGRSLRVTYETPNIIGIDSGGKLAFHEKFPCTERFYGQVTAQIQALINRAPEAVLHQP